VKIKPVKNDATGKFVNPEKIKVMRAAWLEMSRKIKQTPGYAASAKKFEAEYAAVKARQP